MPLLIGRRLLPIEPKQGSSPAELHATVWFRNAHQSLHVPCPGLRRRMCAIDPPSFLLAVLLLLPIPDQRNFVPADCTVAAAAQQASFSANRTWRHQGGGRWRAQHVQVLGQKRGPATACDHLARSLAGFGRARSPSPGWNKVSLSTCPIPNELPSFVIALERGHIIEWRRKKVDTSR